MGKVTTPGKRAERLAALYRQRPDLQPLFAPLIASMEVMEEQLRASNRLLEKRAAADPVCARLMSVPGVGPITALTMLPASKIRTVLPEATTSAPMPGLFPAVPSRANATRVGTSQKLGIHCCAGAL